MEVFCSDEEKFGAAFHRLSGVQQLLPFFLRDFSAQLSFLGAAGAFPALEFPPPGCSSGSSCLITQN